MVTISSTDYSTTDIEEWTPIPISEEQHGSDSVWTRWFDPVRGGLMILLPPLTHVLMILLPPLTHVLMILLPPLTQCHVTLTIKEYCDRWQCENSDSVYIKHVYVYVDAVLAHYSYIVYNEVLPLCYHLFIYPPFDFCDAVSPS